MALDSESSVQAQPEGSFLPASAGLGPGPTNPPTEASPMDSRLEFDALVREYDSLRSEVQGRISKQQDITSFAIALLAGFAALTQILSPSTHLEVTSPQLR